MSAFIQALRCALIVALLLATSCNQLFNSDEPEPPINPVVEVTLTAETVQLGETQSISAAVSNIPENALTNSTWSVSAGSFIKNSELEIDWTAPFDTMEVDITLNVKTELGGETSRTVRVGVGNAVPDISTFSASSARVLAGNTITLSVQASDPEGLTLDYRFLISPDEGILSHSGNAANTASWQAPDGGSYSGKYYTFIAEVTDNLGFISMDTLQVLAYSDFYSIWMVDSGTRRLAKYTGNGLLVFNSPVSFSKPVAVTSDIDESFGCYVADYDAATVYKIDAGGNTVASYGNIPTVIDLAMHRDTRTIWALGVGDNSVTVIDGFQDVIVKKIHGFFKPRGITINQATGDVWINEQGNNRVVQLSALTEPANLPDTISTQNTAIYPENGTNYFNSPMVPFVRNESAQTLYVADRDDREVERLMWNGTGYTRNTTPVSLVSAQPRAVFVTALSGLFNVVVIIANNGKLFAFSEGNSATLTTLAGDYTFQSPHALAVDPMTGECWIGDNGTNQLVKIRINPDFTFATLVKLNGFIFIEDVVINQ